jgi:hypothetical protein
VSLLLLPLAAFIVVWNTMFCAWLASHFISADKAKIAAFSFTLGMIVNGRPSQFANMGDFIALLAGALLGLAFVGFQFFRKEAAHA